MPKRTREIWQNLVKQFERSGKTQEQFATEREIPLTTLRSWIYRLRRESAEQATAMLPVRVISSASPLTARRPEDEGGAAVEVVLVRFAAGTASELIADVVARLRRC